MEEQEQVYLRDVLNLDEAPKDEPITIYDKDNKAAAIVSNVIDWQYTRLQIRKYKIEGCYFYFNGKRYEINSNGMLPDYPNVFNSYIKLTAELALFESASKYIPKSKLVNIDKCPMNEYVNIYDNEDNLICHTNDDLQFNWVRAEIKEKKLKGCYLIFRDQKIEISEHGDPYEYPHGMFEFNVDQLCRMI